MSSTRQVRVVLEGDNSSLNRSLDSSARAAENLDGKLGSLGSRVSENEKHYTRAGTALVAIGAATTLTLGASAAAAVSWESDFAGVRKTVDDTAEGYAELDGELRGMARTLPSTHREIAATAEAAGQLGVKREDISAFTATMVDLGETTDLTSDQAATGMAQIMNVMGTAGEDVERFGSTLVELGNNGASTESQILDMSVRIAGAAKLAGASESDVLALANAMASVGIESQLGGSAMSRAMTQMNSAVLSGGEELAAFAEVAGVTAEEFAEAWRADPVAAVGMFVDGLARIDASGQDAATALSDVGLKGTENAQVFLRLTGASDLLNDSITQGRAAWSENSALADEAAKRYATVSSQLEVLRNNVFDAGITAGEVLLPALTDLAEGGTAFFGWISDLPDEAIAAGVGVGALTSATALLLGGTLLAIPKLIEMHATLVSLRTTAPFAAAAIRGVALAAGGLAALVVLAEAKEWINGFVSRNDDLEQMAETLVRVADAADFADEKVSWMTRSGALGTEEFISGADALDRFATSAQIAFGDTLGDKLGRLQNSGSLERFIEDAKGYDAALAELVNSGNSEEAAAKFDMFWNKVKDIPGVTMDEVMPAFSQYEEAMRNAGVATQETLDIASSFDAATFPNLAPAMTDNARAQAASAEATGDNAEATEELAKAHAELLGQMATGSQAFVSVSGALGEYNAEVQEWAQGEADATATAEDSWEDFVDAHEFEMEEYLSHLRTMAEDQANWQSNMSELVGKVSSDTLEHLAKLGPEGAPLVAALTDATAEELAEFDALFAASGSEAAGAWASGIKDQEALFKAAAGELGTEAANEILDKIQAGEVGAAAAVLDYDLKAELEVLANTDPAAAALLEQVEQIEATRAYAQVWADTGEAQAAVMGWEEETNNTRPVPKVDADTDPATGEVRDWARTTDALNPVPDVNANTRPAAGDVSVWQTNTNRKSATVSVYASTSDIYGDVRSAMHWISGLRPVLRVGMNRLALAGGGPVPEGYERVRHRGAGRVSGPGTPTSDDVNAHLSDNEHVWAAREVDALGGHAEVYKLRRAALAGTLRGRYDVGGAEGRPYAERMREVAPRFTTPAPSYRSTPAAPAVDASQLKAAVREGISGLRLSTRLEGRDILVTLEDAQQRYGSRMATMGGRR